MTFQVQVCDRHGDVRIVRLLNNMVTAGGHGYLSAQQHLIAVAVQMPKGKC